MEFGLLEKQFHLYQKNADKGAAIIQSYEDAVLLVDDEHYQVASGQLDSIEYDVHCDVGCCSYYAEQQGGFCKHKRRFTSNLRSHSQTVHICMQTTKLVCTQSPLVIIPR